MTVEESTSEFCWRTQTLTCPDHPAAVLVRPPDGSDRAWWCPQCLTTYPVTDGVPDLAGGSAAADPAFAAEADQWDRQAETYEAGRAADAVYTAGVDAAVAALGPRTGESVLDIGCGTGLTVRAYCRPDITVTAADASIASLRVLGARVPTGARVRLVRADVARLPFADGAFDAVLCANVLQQVRGERAQERCVAEMVRVLRPSGRLVVTVHHYSLVRRWKGWPKEGAAGGHSGAVRYVHRCGAAELTGLFGPPLRLTRLYGAAFPLPYRFKLSPVSRAVERVLRRVPGARAFASMLVAVGEKSTG